MNNNNISLGDALVIIAISPFGLLIGFGLFIFLVTWARACECGIS